jgi:hypothetical protein
MQSSKIVALTTYGDSLTEGIFRARLVVGNYRARLEIYHVL